MEVKKQKKPSAFYAKLVAFFKSRTARNLVFSALFVVAIFFMFMVDEKNLLRAQWLPFLESNFMQGLFNLIGLQQYNVGMTTWIIFGSICLFGIVFLVCSIFAPKFARSIMVKKELSFSENKKTYTKYKLLFYIVPLLIAAALIFLFIMILQKTGAMDIANNLASINPFVFTDLLYTLLISFIFFVGVIVAILAVFFILRFIFWLIGSFVWLVSCFTKDINASSKRDEEKAYAALEEVHRMRKIVYTETPITMPNVSVAPAMAEAQPSQPAPAQPSNDGYNGGANGYDKVIANDMFHALELIDAKYKAEENTEAEQAEVQTEEQAAATDITLEQFALQFQSFAINNHKIYYELPVIRTFLAGLASSRLIILEGLSGTGKTMLPRLFTEFINGKSLFVPVQSTWRDKSDVIGYYSEFTKTFKVTEFLKGLYSANYYNEPNLMVLDEMNLSRIEYYFADFLSVLEYPEKDWLIKVIEPEKNQTLPEKLTGGYLQIPNNTWFVGTANTDDSTFTITDKVYDRALVIDFKERFAPIFSDYDSNPINIDSASLNQLFTDAINDESNCLTSADKEKFGKLCEFVRENFDIRFGNRIMVQIEKFVPVYVATGGKKEEALDIMLARKILRKLDRTFNDYIKDSLIDFKKLLNSLYGQGLFVETEKFVDKFIKRLV